MFKLLDGICVLCPWKVYPIFPKSPLEIKQAKLENLEFEYLQASGKKCYEASPHGKEEMAGLEEIIYWSMGSDVRETGT